MRFTLELETGNDALTGPDSGFELARILRDLAGRCEDYPVTDETDVRGPVMDVNGNRVGTWAWSA